MSLTKKVVKAFKDNIAHFEASMKNKNTQLLLAFLAGKQLYIIFFDGSFKM